MSQTIMRTIVDIPDQQLDSLATLCQREGISRAEAVRRAVASYLDSQTDTADDDAYGIWRKRKVAGVAYQRKLRTEWSR